MGATFILAAALWLLPAPAPAQTGAGVAPPVVAATLAQPRLAGSAPFTFWGFEVYQARLWVEPGFDSGALARQRFALELGYQRNFKGRDIAQRSLDEMRRIGTISDAQAQAWLQAMAAAFPDVAPGDRLTGLHLPGQGARFLANGQPRGDIADPEFARLFFGIWLSERTSEPRLRLALLGQGQAGN